MIRDYSEAEWEHLALDTLGELAWHTTEGKRIAPGSGERESWQDLVLRGRLRDAIDRADRRAVRVRNPDSEKEILISELLEANGWSCVTYGAPGC